MLLPPVQDSLLASRFPLQNHSMVERELKLSLRLVIQSSTPVVVTVLPFGWNQRIIINSKLAYLNTVMALMRLHRLIGSQCNLHHLERK